MEIKDTMALMKTYNAVVKYHLKWTRALILLLIVVVITFYFDLDEDYTATHWTIYHSILCSI